MYALDSVGLPRRREEGLKSLDPPQRAEMDGLSRILPTGQLECARQAASTGAADHAGSAAPVSGSALLLRQRSPAI